MTAPTLDDRRVRYLFEAVLAGSIRAAADKLDMNPSVVSRQIAQLESELVITLLERHGRGVKATQAGAVLVDYYRQHAAHQDDALAKLQAIRGLDAGHVDVVLGEGFVSDLMDAPLANFCRRYPGITFTLHLAGSNDIQRFVEEDLAHIGLIYNPPAMPGIRSQAAITQPMCAIVAPGHPIAARARLTALADLTDWPVALMHGSYGTRQIIQMAEQQEKIRLHPKLVTNSISVIKHFVRADFGVSILPAFAVSQEIDSGLLACVPIDNPLLAKCEAHIVTRLGRQLSPAAHRLLQQLMATMRAFQKA